MSAVKRLSKKRELVIARIFNALIFLIIPALGISLIWTGDDENRYWQGKAIGGAIAILSMYILLFGLIAIYTYKETRDFGKVKAALKEVILAFLSFQPNWKAPKKHIKKMK